MGTTTINISMPDSLRLKVEEAMESDGYGNTSEFFRDLARDYIKRRQEKKLEEMLLEGLNSGFTPWTKQDFEDIKQRGLKRIEAEREKR